MLVFCPKIWVDSLKIPGNREISLLFRGFREKSPSFLLFESFVWASSACICGKIAGYTGKLLLSSEERSKETGPSAHYWG